MLRWLFESDRRSSGAVYVESQDVRPRVVAARVEVLTLAQHQIEVEVCVDNRFLVLDGIFDDLAIGTDDHRAAVAEVLAVRKKFVA